MTAIILKRLLAAIPVLFGLSIIVFLMWVWIMMMVLVTGGELNAQLEHQTAKDTTVGKPREPGERRATLADQIAALKAHR